jgi:YidC/Oxa1 family membrane protein insertase
MSLFSLFDPAVVLVHTGLTALAAGLHPVLGSADVAVALVLVTLIVRACLLPLAVAVLRAERARQALAPELARLRSRHAEDPARLVRELQAAHREAGISPFAGMLPALVQGPALFVIYRLCKLPLIGGGPNAVLTANLLGAPLAAHLPGLVLTAGLLGTPTLLAGLLISAMLLVAYASARQQVRRLRAASIGEIPPAQLLIARVLPFGTVVAVAVVPFAVSIYLLTSTTWMLAERAVLPRIF